VRYTLRQLEYVVAAAEAGSVTVAAERTHASQPTVSAAIARVERSLGVQLFIRHHAQGLSVTPAGREFVREAGSLLRHASEVEGLARALNAEVTGPLGVGCLVTLAPLIGPRLCQSFERQHPRAAIELFETGQDGLLSGLRSGSLAVALTYDLELGPDIAFAQLAELPPHALLPAGHRLAGRRAIPLDRLAREPFVLLDLPLSREYFRSLFVARGLEPQIARRSPHPEVVRAMVANGFGYTIVNALPVNDRALDGGPLCARPLVGDHRPMRLGLATLRGLRETRAAIAFREHCLEAVRSGRLPGIGTACAATREPSTRPTGIGS
jgi:DNA-binding transcriptional LysR family regulator